MKIEKQVKIHILEGLTMAAYCNQSYQEKDPLLKAINEVEELTESEIDSWFDSVLEGYPLVIDANGKICLMDLNP